MSRRTVLAAAGTLALLIGVVATFPARLALSWFAPPEVEAWGIQGTVWRGRAAEVVVRERSLGEVSWRALPTRVMMLRPTWDLDLRQLAGYARGRFGFSLAGDVQTIADLEASLALESLPPGIVQRGVTGRVRISLERLVLEQGWPVAISGHADVGTLVIPNVIVPIGPLEFRFSDQSELLLAEVRSVGGPLEIDGRVELFDRGEWRLVADLAPGDNPPREMVQGLALVGEDIGNGRRRLTVSGER